MAVPVLEMQESCKCIFGKKSFSVAPDVQNTDVHNKSAAAFQRQRRISDMQNGIQKR